MKWNKSLLFWVFMVSVYMIIAAVNGGDFRALVGIFIWYAFITWCSAVAARTILCISITMREVTFTGALCVVVPAALFVSGWQLAMQEFGEEAGTFISIGVLFATFFTCMAIGISKDAAVAQAMQLAKMTVTVIGYRTNQPSKVDSFILHEQRRLENRK